MKYIYMMRTDRYTDDGGISRTLYGIDVWRLPDRDARLHRSYPGLFSSPARAEELVRSLTDGAVSPEAAESMIASMSGD